MDVPQTVSLRALNAVQSEVLIRLNDPPISVECQLAQTQTNSLRYKAAFKIPNRA
jgi:hypothetical protein